MFQSFSNFTYKVNYAAPWKSRGFVWSRTRRWL